MTKVTFNLNGLRRVVNGMNGAARHRMFTRWGARYLAFLKARFARNSRGGGDWKPLSEATKKRRRGNGKNAAILIDTGTMKASLNHVAVTERGVEVGFADAAHPSGGSVREIAGYHDRGEGVPERKILVPPDAATEAAMKEDVRRAIQESSHG